MKFSVREGFVFQRTDLVDVPAGPGKTKKERREMRAYAGEEIELTERQALEHLHQLEPLDKEAKALLARNTRESDPVVAGGMVDPASIQTAVQAGIQAGVASVIEALRTQGLITAAAAPASSPAA